MQRSWNKIETLEEALGRIAEIEEEIERLRKASVGGAGSGGGACGPLHETRLTPGGTILGLEELVLTVDAEGRVAYVNRPMARFLGVESRRSVAGAVLASIDRTALGRGFFRGIIEAARGSKEPCVVERECPGLDPGALPGPGGRERPRTAPFLRIVATARGGAANIVVQDVTAIKWLERNFARYVTPEVLACMYETPDADFFSPIRKEISILFGDLRGFTRMSSEMPPERVHETVNSFFREMVACAGLYGGSVDKFVGDEIMLLFGAPLPLQDHALRGLCCAADMQARHRRWMKRRRDGGLAAPGLGIGVASGLAVVGNVGTPERLDYTALGHTVNLAARLCADAKEGESLASAAAYEMAKETIESGRTDLLNVPRLRFDPRGPRRFKNVPEPVEVVCVAGPGRK